MVLIVGDLMATKLILIVTGIILGNHRTKKVHYMIVKEEKLLSIKLNQELQWNPLKNSNPMYIWIFTQECKDY
jgi:hypothetical protein